MGVSATCAARAASSGTPDPGVWAQAGMWARRPAQMASPRTRRRAVRWLIERIWIKIDDDATPAGRRKAPRRMASFPSRAPRGRCEAPDLPDRHVPEAPPLARPDHERGPGDRQDRSDHHPGDVLRAHHEEKEQERERRE